MAKTTKKSEQNEEENNAVNLPATNNQAVSIARNDEAFAMIDALEKAKESDLTELTSNLLKLEAGEIFVGLLTNEVVDMPSTDDDGNDYEAVVLFNKDRERVLCADAVVVSTARNLIKQYPDFRFIAVRLTCKGMKKSSKDSKKEYRDIKIKTL